MTRWGYTARAAGQVDGHQPVRHAFDDHRWRAGDRRRVRDRLHAVCGAALYRLGPDGEAFDPTHPRACRKCGSNP